MKANKTKAMSSAICPKFAQNAWRKDLCSNCFKSKEEHKQSPKQSKNNTQIKKTELPKVNATTPTKSIMKGLLNKSKKCKVSFPKELHKIIGYGGEWSDEASDDDELYNNNNNKNNSNTTNGDDLISSTDDEDNQELKRLTKSNTDFNMNNGNLLGDPEENIKKSFAALKLGAPQVDSDGKKQTLKINVTPFGTPSKLSSMKAKFELNKEENRLKALKKTENDDRTSSTVVNNKEIIIQNGDGKNSPPIERAMEKSLLEEISETLEMKQKEAHTIQSGKDGKIKFEISSLSETSSTVIKSGNDLKKPIARNTPITKDHVKPKISIFSKYSDSSDSNTSDTENGVSAYYDVVETTTNGCYENITKNNKNQSKDEPDNVSKINKSDDKNKASSVYSTSQYITDMLLSSRTKSASYSLHEGSFMTSKITSDGLIVTKCASDDALDSTGSSFDGSSDEEASYNMNRSESDSGIGISISNEYNITQANDLNKIDKKLSASTNNSDYEDIQVQEDIQTATAKNDKIFTSEKSRELAGEPDGSADPDGNNTAEIPELPKSPPPLNSSSSTSNLNNDNTITTATSAATSVSINEVRSTFLQGMQKNIAAIKKPDVPAKPSTVNVMKTFAKRQPTHVEQQVVNQLQQVIKTPVLAATTQIINNEQNNDKQQIFLTKKDGNDYSKFLKKGRAPNPPPINTQTTNINDKGNSTLSSSSSSSSSPPPTPEKDYNYEERINSKEIKKIVSIFDDNDESESKNVSSASQQENKNNLQQDENHSSIYTRNPAVGGGIKSTSPVIREKDKRERAIINPKFRSLNTFTHRKQQQQQQQLLSTKMPTTPEPAPRKNLSMSEECLVDAEKKKKTKFSIKKFLRMGTSKTTDNLHKKDGIYSEIVTGDDGSIAGKPRLVIIHPIDINTTAVEVVKEIAKNNNANNGNISANGNDGGGGGGGISPTIVTGKPPAPPQRSTNIDGHRLYEINKPARPPPPKSAELRRKQKISFNVNPTGSVKSKSDNVYANLGEIRSSIAPRKPERTASMREREAQLELARKRMGNDNLDSISVCSSNGGSLSNDQINYTEQIQQQCTIVTSSTKKDLAPQAPSLPKIKTIIVNPATPIVITSSSPSSILTKPIITDVSPKEDKLSTFERSTRKIDIESNYSSGNIVSNNSNNNNSSSLTSGGKSVASKLEIFEKGLSTTTQDTNTITNNSTNNNNNKVKLMNDGLKDSVRKISSTIDSYLKDKRDYESMYEMAKTIPPPTPARNFNNNNNGFVNVVNATGNNNDIVDLRRNYELMTTTSSTAGRGINQSRSSFQDNQSMNGGGYTTRSEYGGGIGNRAYGGFNNSLANIPRVVSASYCGSEMGESDIYSPYSFYGSEAGGDVANDIHDSVWGIASPAKSRVKTTNRLRMRKGRSVVHKSIEDNYSAVVVANHEALAQVLDQLQQTPIIPTALRPLANALNLRFDDFNIIEGAQPFVVGKRAFHAAIWNTAPVTLALTADCNQMSGELNQLSGGVSGVLNPITEFCDLVPSFNLPLIPSIEVHMMQATISVLSRMQLDTLQSIGSILKNKSQILDKHISNFRGSIPNLSGGNCNNNGSSNVHQNNEQKMSNLRNVCSVQNLSTLNEESSSGGVNEANDKSNTIINDELQLAPGMPTFDDVMCREVGFIMLQLVNGLKNLQAKAIEEMPLSLSNVILSKEVDNKDAQARLCVLHGINPDEEEPMGPLCKCAHIALCDMLPSTKLTGILSKILLQERSESLSKAKAVLEFALWGPSDVALTGSTKERELALQRWLDLERATVLHGLVRTRIELTVYDECHLMFLVRSSAKIMNEAAKILSKSNNND